MALTNNGTAVYLTESYLPAGYTKPTVTKFSDSEYKDADVVVTIAKSTVENANKVTTFTALVAAVTAAVSAIITADFDTVDNTVTAFANLKFVDTNNDLAGVLYSNGALNYLCTVDIFVKTVAL
jgi:hypothetical protein